MLDPSENGISHLFGPGTDFVEGSCEERHDPGIEQQAAGGAADAPCQKLLVFVPFTIKASMLLQSGRVKLSVLVRYRGGVLPPCKAR